MPLTRVKLSADETLGEQHGRVVIHGLLHPYAARR
jgi:hypothetical protein